MLRVGQTGRMTDWSGFIPPLTAGLKGWFFPWAAVPALQARNYATGLDGTVAGTPAFNAGFAAFTGGARIATDVAEPLNMSLYLVARSTDTNAGATTRPQWLANRNGPATGGIENTGVVSTGVYIGPSSTTQIAFIMSHVNAGVNGVEAATITATPGAWRLYCGRIVNNTSIRLDDLTGGATATNTAMDGTRNRSPDAFRLGNNCSGNAGTGDVACAGIYDVTHTDAERDQIAAVIRTIMSARWGITV